MQHKTKRLIKSDLKRIDKMADEDIDYSGSPELDDSFFKRVRVKLSENYWFC